MEIKETKPNYDITDRGFRVRAWGDYKKETGDALIEIQKDGAIFREFKYPAYKIWNIAAHFTDIVDGELENSDIGYRTAGSTGFGGVVMPKTLPEGDK
jgi:hypothetical protein